MSFVQVQLLTKHYEGKAIVDGVSFELEKGMCISLLGPNGAGKTTTLRMLSGLIKPTSGSITFAEATKQTDIRSLIGYLPQYPVFYNWMTGREFLIHVGRLAHLSKQEAVIRSDQLLKKVGLAEAKHLRIGKYSGGMKQRLGIAQAMIHTPKFLMLDEPVASLDPLGRREVLTLIEDLKEETTILFSTHILSDAEEVSDKLLFLQKGKLIYDGTLDDLRESNVSNRIELQFKESAKLYVQHIQSIPTVQKVSSEGAMVSVEVENLEFVRREIFRKAAHSDWPLLSYETDRLSLEELFMKVVNQRCSG